MNELRKVILGLGLVAGVTLSANDALNAFYPPVENDTPDYILAQEINVGSNTTHILAKSSVSKEVLEAFYPEKNDKAIPDYAKGLIKISSDSSYVVYQPEVLKDTFKAFFPPSNDDTSDYLKI